MSAINGKRAYQNPLDELVEDMVFAVQLYRKAAFYSHHEYIQSMLLDLADQRDMALARILPYASLQERAVQFRQNVERVRNQKVTELISEIQNDPEMIVVKQMEGETLCVFERVMACTKNTLVKYMVQDLSEIFERQLNNLFSDDTRVA